MSHNPDFQTLIDNLGKDLSGLKPVKAALITDGAGQFFAQALRACGQSAGYNIQVNDIAYTGVERAARDSRCELYASAPDYLIICHCYQASRREFYGLPANAKSAYANNKISRIERLYSEVQKHCGAKIIVCTIPELNDGVFGNFALKTQVSLPRQICEFNYALMKSAEERGNMFICDIRALTQFYGFENMQDAKLYVNADMDFALDALPVIAKNIIDIISSSDGRIKKCLIFDLDNTIWGGIIGDDGLDKIEIGNLGMGKAYTEMQLFIRQLKERGIILAVCSKNDERLAKEPFEKHPDMILRLGDISVFTANWNNKAENIRNIQKTLNVAFDSMVFLDDNPVERDIVRRNIEGICVPELPEDPAEWLDYLAEANLFETASYSAEDLARTRQYQQEAARNAIRGNCADESEFLSSLQMTSAAKALDRFTLPRISQLTQRTNQFNMRTVRYSEEDIATFLDSRDAFCFSFTLRDRLGDSGLVSAVILRPHAAGSLFVDTWVMSCRVFKRTLEHFVVNYIAAFAKSRRFGKLTGEYRPTAKNSFVKDLYSQLGFRQNGQYWELALDSFKPLETFVKEEAADGNNPNS